MNSIQFLISTAISVYSFILILRVWFQVAKVAFLQSVIASLGESDPSRWLAR